MLVGELRGAALVVMAVVAAPDDVADHGVAEEAEEPRNLHQGDVQTAPLFALEEGVGAEDLITEGRCLDEGGVAGKRVEGGADSLVGSLGVELDAGGDLLARSH